jgi:hypothetical protein
MNHTQRWLARVRPRHNPAENALIANMRDDPHIPWLNSLAAMRHYARQRWPQDPGVQSLITGVWQRYHKHVVYKYSWASPWMRARSLSSGLR